jgi:hypothetical protein
MLFNCSLHVINGLVICIMCCRVHAQLPAWPFVATSFGVGVFALLPYFAFWKPAKNQTLPPKKEELVGDRGMGSCGVEGAKQSGS